ncbi:sigma-70 family RNA polymerase sigma factor [Bowmanella dokdonensis]|uniref:Sigma-70 family RNA polymerase sigma factor n=1 Tax=Bowmanella dokdonensis TaxID=751969 RepID=A0A939DNC8_9ALTE|nr:sigma-70 family RNA polymerase sigma factor [Bowmanella dokdonensis]MBN7825817.1 sigma-70 family RNA polymerase sigma factor [Bowmanella dokdonensis]
MLSRVAASYGPLLSRVAASYEANPELRKELLQEISLAVWQAMSAFRGQSSEKTYLLKVAHNRCVSHVASQVRLRDREALDESLPDDKGPEPEASAIGHQRQNALLVAVRRLPLQERQVVTLFMEGLSYQETAEICGLTGNHVGVILSRAKARLSKELEDV